MTNESKLNANRQNATHSTGPRTESGKAASSRDALTLGLYTRADYVKPEERDLYKEFCETMYDQLTPASLLEESFVSEITGATWRLRRCSAAESELADYAAQDPMLDDSTEKTRRSVERARAAAHGILNRSINQLRKLQTERITREQLGLGNAADAPLAESRKVCEALNLHTRNQKLFAKAAGDAIDQQLESIINAPGPDWTAIDLNIARERAAKAEMASICKTEQTVAQPEPIRPNDIDESDRETPTELPPDFEKAA